MSSCLLPRTLQADRRSVKIPFKVMFEIKCIKLQRRKYIDIQASIYFILRYNNPLIAHKVTKAKQRKITNIMSK